MRSECPACLTGRPVDHAPGCPDAGEIRLIRFDPANENARVAVSHSDAQAIRLDYLHYGVAFSTPGGRRVDPTRVIVRPDGVPYVALRNPIPRLKPAPEPPKTERSKLIGLILVSALIAVAGAFTDSLVVCAIGLAGLLAALAIYAIEARR